MRISLAKTKMADPIEIREEDTYILSLFNDFSQESEFDGLDLVESTKVANVHAVFAMIYASMTFNCPLMLNKVGPEKIPLPQAHMLFRFVVYRDSYLDTNPKIAIYHDTVFRGDTHP